MYDLTLTFQKPINFKKSLGRTAGRLVCDITDSTNLPSEVFVHQRIQTGDLTNPTVDEFMYVAGPLDMVEISSSEPDERGFIRKSTLDLAISSPSLYLEAKQEIISSCRSLCETLSKLDDLEEDEVVVVSS
jgi:hypothetical protein